MAVKVDIISGFLGAGKTTLIKKLIKEELYSEKVVLIENEFGEISIDSGILKNSGIEIKEMNSGCICCSLVGDFSTALKEVLKSFTPDRVIIEPSGVGKLSGVVAACKRTTEQTGAKLNVCAAVVDVVKYKMYSSNFGEFFRDQIKNAKTIVLSRTQFLNDHKLADLVKEIQSENQKANILTDPWDNLTGESLLASLEADIGKPLENRIKMKVKYYNPDLNIKQALNDYSRSPGLNSEANSQAAIKAFESWGTETPKNFSRADLQNILKLVESKKYGNVIRAKGIVPARQENWLQFDYTPGEITIRPILPDYTGKISVIGENLNKTELARLFGV